MAQSPTGSQKSNLLVTTPSKCHVEIQINDSIPIKEEHEMETYFRRLVLITRIHGMFFSKDGSRWTWLLNFVINISVLVIVIWLISFEVSVVTANGVDLDMEVSTMLCGIAWNTQAVISMGFLIYWQVHGDLDEYTNTVISQQKGESIAKGTRLLKRSLYTHRLAILTCIVVVLSWHYGPASLIDASKYEFLSNPWLKPIHSYASIHLMSCWSLAMFLFNLLIDGTYLEIKHYNDNIIMLQGDDEYVLKNELLWLMMRHSKITKAIAQLDRLFRVYAFTMVATLIPSTLLTLIMLAHRAHDHYKFVLLGLPSLGMTFYGFLSLTLAPARLYDEMYRSKNYLCQNDNIWHPHRPEIYQISLVLSSHMEQPNMGLTIWGFAILSKPLILATFSGMIMMLSLILEVVPTIEEIVESVESEEFRNSSWIER